MKATFLGNPAKIDAIFVIDDAGKVWPLDLSNAHFSYRGCEIPKRSLSVEFDREGVVTREEELAAKAAKKPKKIRKGK